MKGKTVVITGGTSGIGEIAAERLALMGARIVLIARDKCRGEATLARLHERAPGLGHAVHYADLARIPEMKPVSMSSKAAFIAALFLSRHPPDDQISRLRLPLWTSTGKAEPCCGGRMIVIEVFARGQAPRHKPSPAAIVIRIDTS